MIRQGITSAYYEIGEIENKEIVDIEDPIVQENKSNETIKKNVNKVELESNQKVGAGIYVGYPKKAPINSISITPHYLNPTNSQSVPISARYPVAHANSSVVNTNGNYDVIGGDDILGVGKLASDLRESGQAIKDNFNSLASELTSGWDYDSITSGDWADAYAIKISISNFLKNPSSIASYLSTLQANVNNESSQVSILGHINMNLGHRVPFAPHQLKRSQYVVSSIVPIQSNFKRTKKDEASEPDWLIPTNDITLIITDTQELIEKRRLITTSEDYSWNPMDIPYMEKSFYLRVVGESMDDSGKSHITKTEPTVKPTATKDAIDAFKGFSIEFAKNNESDEKAVRTAVDNYALKKIEAAWTNLATLNKKYANGEGTGTPYIIGSTVSTADNSAAKIEVTYAITVNDYKGQELRPALKDKALDISQSISTIKTQITNLRNRSIEYLIQSGSDFFQHMYDVMLVCSSETGEVNSFENFFKKINEESSIIKTNLGDSADSGCFMVRAGSIDVPQIENDSYDVKFLFNTIKKTRSRIKYEKRAELKILMDEPLIFMTFFNLLTNNNMTIFNSLHADNRYPMKFAPYSTNRLIKEHIVDKKIRLDIIIKHQKLLHYPDFELLKNSWNLTKVDDEVDVANFGGLASSELPIWWFEDVNFLGQGSDITFDRDTSNTVEVSYPFLFKRCVKVNRIHKGGQDASGLRLPISGGAVPQNDKEYKLFSETQLTKSDGVDFFEDQSDQEWFQKYLKARDA